MIEKRSYHQAGGVELLSAIASLALAELILLSGGCAVAQVTSDGTLGTVVDPSLNITGGITVGNTNLFHSFGIFSVPAGATANFLNNSSILNIFSRVTGGSVSDIQGTIQSQGSANLFLINPSGIIFGPNARLNIGGSFVGTTANGIQFPNGGEFSLTSGVDPNNALLTVNPSALFFNQTPTGAIVNQSSDLSVFPGHNLFLVGGDVRVENSGTIRALGGRIELGGLAGNGTIKIEDSTSGSNPSLNFPLVRLKFPDGVVRGDVTLSNGAIVDVVGNNGGDIAITAENINISGGSKVCAGIGSTASSCQTPGSFFGSSNALAGNILFDATGAVNISQSRIENNLNLDASGNSGDIFTAIDNNILFGSIIIQAESFSLTQGAVSTSTFGNGSAGVVFIKTTGPVIVTDSSQIDSSVGGKIGDDIYNNVNGDAGGIIIQAGSISLSRGVEGNTLTTSTFGQGKGGLIWLQTPGDVSIVDSGTGISSNVEAGATGDTLGVRIDARSLFMSGGAEIQVLTRGNGNAGKILINASNVNLTGFSPDGFSTGLLTSSEDTATGEGGLIQVNADTLRLSNAAVLSARTQSAFPGGGIIVNVNTLEAIDGGQILASAYASGASGAILINASDKIILSGRDLAFRDRLLQLLNNNIAQFGKDEGIRRTLQTFDTVEESSGIFADVLFSNSTAQAGAIEINTKDLFILDGATISVDNPGSKASGDIVIVGRDLILLNGGSIKARATSGQGGNLLLNLDTFLLVLGQSGISTTSGFFGQSGSGGNIKINSQYIFAAPFNDNNISANAFGEGAGGNIQLTADLLRDIAERERDSPSSNDIFASSDFGVSGTVSGNILNADPTQGLSVLPTNFIDPSSLISETCAPRGGVAKRKRNQFIVTGRGGLPPDPNAAFPGEAVVGDLGTVNGEEARINSEEEIGNSETQTSSSLPDVEAQGWVYGANGEVIFTAQAPNVTPNSSVFTPISSCNGL
ncbi:MAG TPA: hypothetical protein DEG17_11550 [Cyanobacteria bacterium UBA11149]|nr:hypothetical protein [Cyanobacteria bacterium UBA11367]HBE59015.1 hypothetical protein [Cyanobacteria bacterium UBA11366]HBK65257.1 hypothetical protein [Cyanobacteria bacterium UBA11166]HBR74043.1 hypothetical protein [Cyanobacteria bacterium UBA11159]HBS70345.1 hypothetical protein [Cyanobacteria bacterium UBA11153]HBW89482.1 hypothetical protein [Cyanobacteria bacterium UBA11149]HCA94027.1 hypothetical protein [Cyanobacteria bacterium UBA9226]